VFQLRFCCHAAILFINVCAKSHEYFFSVLQHILTHMPSDVSVAFAMLVMSDSLKVALSLSLFVCVRICARFVST